MSREDNFRQAGNPYAASQIPAQIYDDSLDGDLGNPLWSMWFHPRRTIRKITATDPTLHVVLLTGLGGIVQTLNRASTRSTGDSISLPTIICLAVFLGPLSGLISLWIFSHLIRIEGNMIGGIGERENIKAAIAWSYLPGVFCLITWGISLLVFGSEMFTTATPRIDSSSTLLTLFLVIAFVEIVLGIWAFVLVCNAIAEVQGFYSAWSGLGNIILASLLIIVPLLALVFLFLLMA
ncbi:MAG: Yip1 family protein [Planctomycetota bacterium]